MNAANNGIIGTLGDIIFTVNPRKWHTFKDFSRNTRARWEKNNIHLKSSKAHFLGSELDTASLEIMLDVDFGMNPRAQVAKLQDYCRMGKVMTLIIGDKAEGRGKWYIESVDSVLNQIDNRGNVFRATVTLSLGEYV